MQLPGGVLVDGQLIREYEFSSLTGEFELILGEQFELNDHHVDKVTKVLFAALKRIGNSEVSHAMIEDLSVGDRQYLMRQLASKLDNNTIWLDVVCSHCNEHFDVSYQHRELPVKLASEEYPQITVNSGIGKLLVRFPSGKDQRHIAVQKDDQQSLNCLLKRIVRTASENKPIDPVQLSSKDRKLIEQALEIAAPEIANEIQTHCPHCEQENRVEVDPYSCLTHKPDNVFQDLHQIAMHYHWDEHTILSLPRNRRQLYVNLIDRSRGMTDKPTDYHGGMA
jgi:hypothetical protein